MKRALIGITAGCSLTLFAANASALPDPWTKEKVQLEGHFGGGAYFGDGVVNPYKFGLGLRGGYTLGLPIYVGGLFDGFFGETEALVSGRSFIFQAEGGYDLGLTDWLVLRPKIGLGLTRFKYEICGVNVTEACVDDKKAKFAFQIGVEAPMKLGPVLVAPDIRFNIVGDATAMIIGAGAGYAF